MKLLVDMNLSPSWAERLARHGFEAVHWSVIGAPTSPDDEILAWAREHGFVVVTNDLDFSTILAATSGRSPSVVQVRMRDLLSDAAVNAVATALGTCRERVEGRCTPLCRRDWNACEDAASPSLQQWFVAGVRQRQRGPTGSSDRVHRLGVCVRRCLRLVPARSSARCLFRRCASRASGSRRRRRTIPGPAAWWRPRSSPPSSPRG